MAVWFVSPFHSAVALINQWARLQMTHALVSPLVQGRRLSPSHLVPAIVFGFVFRCFANDVEHRVLESLFVFAQTILLPGVIENFQVKAVAIRTTFKKVLADFVIGLLLKFETATVLHELLEFVRLTPAQCF